MMTMKAVMMVVMAVIMMTKSQLLLFFSPSFVDEIDETTLVGTP